MRSSLGKAIRQCALAMKDMRDYNGEGRAYGFVILRRGRAGKCSNTMAKRFGRQIAI